VIIGAASVCELTTDGTLAVGCGLWAVGCGLWAVEGLLFPIKSALQGSLVYGAVLIDTLLPVNRLRNTLQQAIVINRFQL